MSSGDVIAGVDLGGTKADICVTADDDESSRIVRIATDAHEGAERVLARVCETVKELARGREVRAFGLAVPGVVDNGGVRRVPHIPRLGEVSIDAVIADHLPSVRLTLLNDLNAAAYAASECSTASVMTVGLGTGVAAGLLIDERLVEGSSFAAGEIGDAMVLDLHGELAPLETLAGGRAFDRLGEEHGFADAKALLDAFASDALSDAELSRDVAHRAGTLASAIAVAARTVDPSQLMIFGGLAAHPMIRRYVERALAPQRADGLRIRWTGSDERPVLRGALRAASLTANAVSG